MIIQPITPMTPTNSLAHYASDNSNSTKEKCQNDLNTNIEWYCNGCKNYFKVPDPVRYIYDNEKGELIRKKQLNCPFCGNIDICNNRAECFREKLWQKI